MKQWNKETIEEQLKLHKKQNKDDRYNYICEQFNPIWYCWELEKYTLQKDKEINRLNNIINELEKSIIFKLTEFKRNKDYFIDEKDIEQLYEELEELKESVNNEYEEKINDYIDDLEMKAKQSDRYFNERNELYIKIERLNNTINEIEKYLENRNSFFKEMSRDYGTHHDLLDENENILDKLKELKESGNNE